MAGGASANVRDLERRYPVATPDLTLASATFYVPEGYGPGDEMNVDLPNAGITLNYNIVVPDGHAEGDRFEVLLLGHDVGGG